MITGFKTAEDFNTIGDLTVMCFVQLLKCPKDETQFNTPIEIFADGRKQTLYVNFTMLCKCECENVGDPVSSQDALKKKREVKNDRWKKYITVLTEISCYVAAGRVCF